MRTQQSIGRIAELLSRFVAQVKLANSIGHTDINRISEDVLVPIFQIAFSLPALENLNIKEAFNFPGADLGDRERKVAIQVTSTPDSDKVKATLEKFVAHHLYDDFTHLRMYILTEKQRFYQGNGWTNIIDRKFVFDKDRDILDHTDLLKAIQELPLHDLQKIENLLESNFGEGCPPVIQRPQNDEREPIFLNLLELFPNEKLFVAQINDATLDLKLPPKRNTRGLAWIYSDHDRVLATLKNNGYHGVRDWVCHSSQLITFRDLTKDMEPLRDVIETESIEEIAPDEFYDTNVDHERVFKTLLDRALGEVLWPKRIQRQHRERLFIFQPINDELKRKERWVGLKAASRTVYVKKNKTKGAKGTLSHRHLAFSTQYHHFGSQWFVSIKPEWFISWDGYHKSNYAAQSVDYLKKNERNQHVANHVRFIAHIIQNPDRSVFEEIDENPPLRFGQLASFTNGKSLNDEAWRVGEPDDEAKKLRDSEAPDPQDVLVNE